LGHSGGFFAQSTCLPFTTQNACFSGTFFTYVTPSVQSSQGTARLDDERDGAQETRNATARAAARARSLAGIGISLRPHGGAPARELVTDAAHE
jgi:hypothetical protein